MYPALDEELEDEQCLPLTGVSCGEIDEALRSLSESAREGPVKTFEQTRKLLKQVLARRSYPLRSRLWTSDMGQTMLRGCSVIYQQLLQNLLMALDALLAD